MERTSLFISAPAEAQLPCSILSAMIRIADHEVVEAASDDVSAGRQSIENTGVETGHRPRHVLRFTHDSSSCPARHGATWLERP